LAKNRTRPSKRYPEAVDIVDVFRSSEKVMPTARDAVAAGAKVLWMQSGVVNEEARPTPGSTA
jgi:predicted CoA-binding protein